jgi:putative transposase
VKPEFPRRPSPTLRQARFAEKQSDAVLREQDAGVWTADVCRKHGISAATFSAQKAKSDGMDVSEAKRLKPLEDEKANPPQHDGLHGHSLRIVPMSPMTVFLGKLIGFYLIAISIGMFVSRRRTLATLDEMARSGPWMLFSGMVATAAGLADVLAHNVWTGGALTIAVTLVGWTALVKGLALLVVPPSTMASAYKAVGYERYFYVWMGAVLVLGLWMALDAFAG